VVQNDPDVACRHRYLLARARGGKKERGSRFYRCGRDRYVSKVAKEAVVVGVEVADLHVRQLLLELTRQGQSR
jgi:hypothetical protein